MPDLLVPKHFTNRLLDRSPFAYQLPQSLHYTFLTIYVYLQKYSVGSYVVQVPYNRVLQILFSSLMTLQSLICLSTC